MPKHSERSNGDCCEQFGQASRSSTFVPRAAANYDLAEVAYRVELGRPGHAAQSFIEAFNAKLNQDAASLEVQSGALELVGAGTVA